MGGKRGSEREIGREERGKKQRAATVLHDLTHYIQSIFFYFVISANTMHLCVGVGDKKGLYLFQYDTYYALLMSLTPSTISLQDLVPSAKGE